MDAAKCFFCSAPAVACCDYPARTGATADVKPTCKKPLCQKHRIIHADGTRHTQQGRCRYTIGYCPDHHTEMKQRLEPIPPPTPEDDE